jgi:4-hydroxy-4-methyl-2-oxoglutarate aldolase
MANPSFVDRRWKYPVVPFRIRRTFDRPSADVVRSIADCYVPDLSDAVGGMYTMRGIQSIYHPAVPATGPAVTVKCPPGDNMAVTRALAYVQTGDILVIDAQGFTDWCLGGFQMLQHAIAERGLRGVVVNGAYRDSAEAQAASFPIYAKALSAWSGPKIGPGEINVPVCCGGVIVEPGDVVAASGEGVVVVPRFALQAVSEHVLSKAATQRDISAAAGWRAAHNEAAAKYLEEIYAEKRGIYLD